MSKIRGKNSCQFYDESDGNSRSKGKSYNKKTVRNWAKQFINEELSFIDWYSQNEESINIELAESGADREMDFDPELEFDNRYEKYLAGLK